MASQAEQLVQIREDVERIARAFYEADDADFQRHHPGLAGYVPCDPWGDLPDDLRNHLTRVVEELLRRDVIRVGRRPETGPAPMEGQQALVDPDSTPFKRPEIMTGYPLDEREKQAIDEYLAERGLEDA